jgi:hypothetical protein
MRMRYFLASALTAFFSFAWSDAEAATATGTFNVQVTIAPTRKISRAFGVLLLPAWFAASACTLNDPARNQRSRLFLRPAPVEHGYPRPLRPVDRWNAGFAWRDPVRRRRAPGAWRRTADARTARALFGDRQDWPRRVAQVTVPRFLSLGDRSQFHVQIDNVEGKPGDYALDLD